MLNFRRCPFESWRFKEIQVLSGDAPTNKSTRAAIALFGAVIALALWDIWGDFGDGVSTRHILFEGTILVVAISGVILMWKELDVTRAGLAEALVEAELWKAESDELMKGLSVAIERQFKRWSLSAAEAEIGLFLLKGLSLKEIAFFRGTSERTVREQARSLYRKSGLSGRPALSAFFLEGLLLPTG